MRLPKPRRRLVVAALAVMLAVVAVRLQDRATGIDYYRTVDQQTLALGIVTGPGEWTRVTRVTETPSTVTITVSSLLAPLPGFGGSFAELSVTLSAPIGSRIVIDGRDGTPVRKTRCLPPAYFGPGCT